MATLSSKAKPRQKRDQFRLIDATDHDMLLSLLRYYCLTSDQVRQVLGYKPGSLRYVQKKLKTLTDEGYCVRPEQHVLGRGGKGLYFFRLGRKGLNYLREHGEEVPKRFHLGEAKRMGVPQLVHSWNVNELLIGLELFCRRSDGQLRLERLLGEHRLKQLSAAVTVRGADGQGPVKIRVIPDGWLSITVASKGRLRLAVELDHDSEDQKKWREKVAGLIAWWHGPYQELFDARAVVFAVVTTAGEKRLADLKRWTEAELEELGQKPEASRFFLSSLASVSDGEASGLFAGPYWCRPFSTAPEPLLPNLQRATEGGR